MTALPDAPFHAAAARRPLHAAIGAISLAVLTGCASLSAPATADLPAIATPAQWRTAPAEAGSATALASWWQRFGDAELTALITQALQANTSVRSAQASLQQARAQRDAAQAGLWPTLTGSGSGQRSKSGDAAASNRFQAGLDASWEPDLFGANRSTAQASEADLAAAGTTLANAQVSLAAEVALGYIDLRGLQQRLAIAQASLAAQAETLQITRWRAQAGLAASLDVEQALAAYEQTAAQVPALQTSISQNLNALAVLTGQAPGALNERLASAAPVPQASATLALAIPAEVLRQRPDVRTAEYRIGAALARLDAAEADRYPSLRIGGSVGLSALTLSGLGSGATIANSLLASISLPLFDGGTRRAQVQSQEAALEAARVNYEAAVLTALQDVEDALLALRGDQERLIRQQSAQQAAANADLLARQRYSSGLIDFRTVLDTQRTLLSAQDSVASTQASIAADHVRLYKALGGGWNPEAATTTEPASTR